MILILAPLGGLAVGLGLGQKQRERVAFHIEQRLPEREDGDYYCTARGRSLQILSRRDMPQCRSARPISKPGLRKLDKQYTLHHTAGRRGISS